MDLQVAEKRIKFYIDKKDFKNISDMIPISKEIRNLLRKHLRKLLKENSCPNMVRLLLGRIEALDKNYDKANNYFTKLSVLTITHQEEIYIELAKLEFLKGNFNKAKDYCFLITVPKLKIISYYILGDIEVLNKNYKLARVYLNKGLQFGGDENFYRKLAWLDIRENKLDDALNNLYKYYKSGNEINYNVHMALLFLCKELNVFIKDIDLCNITIKYTGKQIIDYKLNDTIKHIKKHTRFSNYNGNIDDEDIFNPNFTLEDIVSEALINMDEKYKFSTEFCDIYVIPFLGIGAKGSNYLKVATLPNTKKIITMYPIKDKLECDEYNIEESVKTLKLTIED